MTKTTEKLHSVTIIEIPLSQVPATLLCSCCFRKALIKKIQELQIEVTTEECIGCGENFIDLDD